MALKDLIGSIAWHVTAPYRAGRDFVNSHPSAAQIKHHFQNVEPAIRQPEENKLEVVLHFPAAPEAPARMLHEIDVAGPEALPFAKEYAQGVVTGWNLCKQEMLEVKRSDINAQQGFIEEHQLRAEIRSVIQEVVPECAPAAA